MSIERVKHSGVILMKAALIDLLERNDNEGNKYGLSSTITALITQLQEIKGE